MRGYPLVFRLIYCWLNADAISRVAVEDDRFAGRRDRERERESERRIEKYRDQNSIVK